MFAHSSPIQTSDSENLAKIEKHILTTYEDIIDAGPLISLEEDTLQRFGHLPKQETPHKQIKKNAWQILAEAISTVDLQTAEYILKHCQPINLEIEVKPEDKRSPNLIYLTSDRQKHLISATPLCLIAAKICWITTPDLTPLFGDIPRLTQPQEFLDLLLLYGASCTKILSLIKAQDIIYEKDPAEINAQNSLLICDHLNLAYQNWQDQRPIDRDFHILSALRLSCESRIFLKKYIQFNIEKEKDNNFKEFFRYLINYLKKYSEDSEFKITYEQCNLHIEKFEQLQLNKLALEEKDEKSIIPSSSAQDSKKLETNSPQGNKPTSSSKFSSALAAPLPSSSSSSSAQVQVHVNAQTPAQQQTCTPH